MAPKNETLYTIGFAAIICGICSILVSTSAVTLKDRQEENQKLDKRLNVLRAAQLIDPTAKLSPNEINQLMSDKVKTKVVKLADGTPAEDIDPERFDQRRAASNPDTSHLVPDNPAKVTRVANNEVVYEVVEQGVSNLVVLPIEGKGLWSTLYGFLAVDVDGTTVRGISFYEHGETPGLGGEIENPKWQAKWPGRKLFSDQGEVRLTVIKGKAGDPATDPHHVDGLSGATLTSKGVTNLVHFWIGEHGFGPYLEQLRTRRGM